ncbi:MAG: hypothetical protein ACI4P7_05995 [Bacilli bacterium]
MFFFGYCAVFEQDDFDIYGHVNYDIHYEVYYNGGCYDDNRYDRVYYEVCYNDDNRYDVYYN